MHNTNLLHTTFVLVNALSSLHHRYLRAPIIKRILAHHPLGHSLAQLPKSGSEVQILALGSLTTERTLVNVSFCRIR